MPSARTGAHIGIFDRSFYEEVLIVRVHPEILLGQGLPNELLDETTIWKDRYRSIVDLEEHLHRKGARVIKLMIARSVGRVLGLGLEGGFYPIAPPAALAQCHFKLDKSFVHRHGQGKCQAQDDHYVKSSQRIQTFQTSRPRR